MGLGNVLNKARESANKMTLSSAEIKQKTREIISRGYQTIRGSGSIRTELAGIKDKLIELPVGLGARTLETAAKLLTVQPLEATKAAAAGALEAIGRTTELITSPFRTGIAAVEETAKTGAKIVKKTVKLPITAPLEAYKIVENGVVRVSDYLTEVGSPGSAANTNNAAATTTGSELPKAA